MCNESTTRSVKKMCRGQHGAFELLDVPPDYRRYDRSYKPSMLVRILRPLHGDPLVRVRCEPVYDYGRVRAQATAESNHLQYTGLPAPVRLTTDLSLTYLQEGRPFRLARESPMVLTWGQPPES